MKTLWVLFLAGMLGINAVSSAQSSNMISQQIRADGSPVQITLSPADTYLKKIRLWFISKGAMTIPLELGVNAPGGVKVSAQYRLLGSENAAVAADSTGRWIDMKFKANHKGKEKTSFSVKTVRAAISAATGDSCSGLSEAMVQEILRQLSEAMGRTVTRDEFCTTETSGETEPETRPAALQLTGLVHKDTCSGSKTSQYLVRVDLDLSGVDASLLQTGYQMEVIPALVKFTGRVVGKIKVSDGGVYPNQWILLAAKAGYGKDRINVVKWNRRGIASMKTTKIGNYGTYRGVYGTRSPIGGLLRGGKGTFELVTDYSAYSMCFKLRKVLQEKDWPKAGSY